MLEGYRTDKGTKRKSYVLKKSKKPQGLHLHSLGYSRKNIAAKLGISIYTVNGWFRKGKEEE